MLVLLLVAQRWWDEVQVASFGLHETRDGRRKTFDRRMWRISISNSNTSSDAIMVELRRALYVCANAEAGCITMESRMRKRRRSPKPRSTEIGVHVMNRERGCDLGGCC